MANGRAVRPDCRSDKELPLKLHVGNLAKEVSEEQLTELVRPFGVVESTEIIRDRPSGESRGYGFVVFTEKADATAAMAALHGTDLSGKTIRVSDARSPKDPTRLLG